MFIRAQASSSLNPGSKLLHIFRVRVQSIRWLEAARYKKDSLQYINQ